MSAREAAPALVEPAPAESPPSAPDSRQARNIPDDPIPAFTPAAREHITSIAHLRAVLDAYYRPAFVTPVAARDDLEARHAHGTLLRVSRDTGTVVMVGEYDQDNGEPESLQQPTVPKRRKSGGAGTRVPTNQRDLENRIREAGCTISDTGKHLKVTVPGGGCVTVHKTASDHRAIRNTVRDFARAGVDLTR